MPPKPKKKEKTKKSVFKGEEIDPGPHTVEEPVLKVEEAPKDNVAFLESVIRLAYVKAREEGSYSVGNFHRDYGDRVREWKNLTGKKFPEEF